MTEATYAFLEPGRYARGWHILMFSQELAVGDVKPLRYFDHDFVIYRGESGRAAVLDAHCPHLGAHLASDGGRLVGDHLACPFHGWTFDCQGTCVDIPYAKKIPERAVNALRGWPVLEKNGFIALWYDPDNGPTDDYIPDIPQWGDDGWGDWKFQRSRIHAKPCDVIENIVDVAHFPHVHGGEVQSFENRFGEHTVTQISRVKQTAEARMIIPPGLPFDREALREQAVSDDADAWGDAPDDRGLLVNSLDDRPMPEEFVELYPQTAHAAFGQDVAIWQDKVYRADPILCDGDGPINKLRKWYERFY